MVSDNAFKISSLLLLLIVSIIPVLIALFSKRFDHLFNIFSDFNTGRIVKIRNRIRNMDTAIIIASIVSSDKILVNPKSITKSKIVIAAIRIKIITTNGIFFVNDLINCDASELYCVSTIGESTFILSSNLPFLVPLFVIIEYFRY